MDKYTGKRLDGRYEIQELIGVGGMAMVYKAYDTVDDNTVAIKILKDEFLGNSEFIRRFKNESKAIAVLSHPNIVKVNDVSFGDKIQYIVMEYIDGITLKEYISHQHEVPWKEAVHFTVQILQALQHAHEKGIVHRDMKPQNIMLLQDGTIKVTDFGIARFSDNETRTMTDKAIGSVHYIAPEQARGDNTDGKADIYSVGVILYEMLTGKLPFEADSAVSVAIMQMQADPKPLRQINDKIPEGIEEITLKAMRKNPNQRYASASEMLEAIEIFRRNPSVKFNYTYFVDETPTRRMDSLNNVSLSANEAEYEDDYDIYEEEIAVNRSRSIVRWITALVALLVVAAIGIIIYMAVDSSMKAHETKDVDVPKFVGMMYDEIKANKDYKFKFEITADYDEKSPVNVVLRQDPEPGSKQVKENATIKLVINSTSTTTEVPKLKNYTEQEAITKLENKHFNYNVSRVNSAEVAKGYVIDCSPQEGTEMEIGTTITLIVSDGPATEMVEVPDVTDMSYDSAVAALEAKGFATQKTTVSSNKPEGTIIETDPLAGNLLTKGSLITIQVSDGSKMLTPVKYNVKLPANEYAEVKVSVYAEGAKIDEELLIPAEVQSKQIEVNPNGAVNNQKTVEIQIEGTKYMVLVMNFKTGEVRQTYINSSYVPVQGPPESSVESSEDESSEQESSGEESSNASEPTEPEEPSEPESSGDELDETRKRAKYDIEKYFERFYYTDEDYAAGEGIVSDYSSKIDSAQTEDEIYSLIAGAKSEINNLPKLDQETTE